ncbi:MAG: hydroxymethylglutaryl-CoA reductase, degradative [Anaerolineales bacterium]|nr:MAG: hydroxymethylglutaryl-CoA reductase, degradative [Anaerolineales bacterium]
MEKQDRSSRIQGFYDLSLDQRREALINGGFLSPEDLNNFSTAGGLSPDTADHMIENVIGTFSLPIGVALNFQINNRDVLIPMVIEEPSIVAGASFMAKLAREGGGFKAETSDSVMIGQIQILDIEDLDGAKDKILEQKEHLLAELTGLDPILEKLGGGPKDLEVREISNSPIGPFLVFHLFVDVRDAMGANAVNTACEHLAPFLEEITGGRVHLKILSNLADRRLASARCTIPVDSLAFGEYSGEQVRDGIIEAWAFAAADPYRAATHNKGIMNGIDAVLLATGNDWRAVEAGAHAYAARYGFYRSLSTWYKDPEGNLTGELELPLALGIVGGATRVLPGAKSALKLMDVDSAADLAKVVVSVGLAQNLAALRALATDGIQNGHMRLHARQVAIAAGAAGDKIARLVNQLIQENKVRIDRAEEILRDWKNNRE